MSLSHLTRFLVYRNKDRRHYLCVVAARTKREALQITRDHGHRLDRTAYAVEEGRAA